MIEHVRARLLRQRRGLHPGPPAAAVGALRPAGPIRAVSPPLVGTARSTRPSTAAHRRPAPRGASGSTDGSHARSTAAFPTATRAPGTRAPGTGTTRTRAGSTRAAGPTAGSTGAGAVAPRPLLAVLASLGAARRGGSLPGR
ncbi:hypothetical protein [Candidatus Frankia alpina]|uniref:hypothetical protein n=1 Tax=Candidatus Frankia alpina TaxID=2699483 RepID=UPI0013D5AC2C|nr:hypothetical protein [Candidatus Frankia alpina]